MTTEKGLAFIFITHVLSNNNGDSTHNLSSFPATVVRFDLSFLCTLIKSYVGCYGEVKPRRVVGEITRQV